MSTKHSEAMRKRWQDPEYRAAKLAQMRSPEFERRKQEAVRRHWDTRTAPHHQLGAEHPGTAKATVHPTGRDIAWAAGFLEGEGSFYRSSKTAKGTAYVVAYQNNPEPVNRMLALFGGSLAQRAPRRRCPTGAWVWRASGARARGVCMTMYPLMSEKRRGQIREALGHAQ